MAGAGWQEARGVATARMPAPTLHFALHFTLHFERHSTAPHPLNTPLPPRPLPSARRRRERGGRDRGAPQSAARPSRPASRTTPRAERAVVGLAIRAGALLTTRFRVAAVLSRFRVAARPALAILPAPPASCSRRRTCNDHRALLSPAAARQQPLAALHRRQTTRVCLVCISALAAVTP